MGATGNNCSKQETKAKQDAVELAYREPLTATGTARLKSFLGCYRPDMSCQSTQILETYEVCWCKDGAVCTQKQCIKASTSPVNEVMLTKLKASTENCLKTQAAQLMEARSFGHTDMVQ
jgi:hypothetical protein